MKTKDLLISAANCLGSDNGELDNWAKQLIGELSLTLEKSRRYPPALSDADEKIYTDWYNEIIKSAD